MKKGSSVCICWLHLAEGELIYGDGTLEQLIRKERALNLELERIIELRKWKEEREKEYQAILKNIKHKKFKEEN